MSGLGQRVREIGQVVASDPAIANSHGVGLDSELLQCPSEPFKCRVRSAEYRVVAVGQCAEGIHELFGRKAGAAGLGEDQRR